jgi:hypothetical protein
MIRNVTKYLQHTIIIAGIVNATCVLAQNTLSQSTQVEVGFGIAVPDLQNGEELTRSKTLRDEHLSYFEDSGGNRRDVGAYSALRGLSIHVGFYKPLKKVNGLMMGAMVRNTQTGSTPTAGYAEGYYFNFITAGIAFKYYPFKKTNIFAKTDLGLASVLTKNRFLNESGEQNFFHQFGIGSGGSVGVGHSFTPFSNKSKSIDALILYQQLNTRVEVNGVGDDHWKFGAFNLSIAMSF